jgi:hypothetical protein
VIVSPEARFELDRCCMIGRGWWNDGWWPHAVASGYMHLANHSWDHNHDALPPRFGGGARGTFATIDNDAKAEHQIGQGAAYLRRTAPNPGCALFAYPYGESNEFLRESYLPRRAGSLGLKAAFGTRPEHVRVDSERRDLPRYVFGRDWTDPAGLEAILMRS